MAKSFSTTVWVEIEPITDERGLPKGIRASRMWQRRPQQSRGPLIKLRFTVSPEVVDPPAIQLVIDPTQVDKSVVVLEMPKEAS